MKRTFRNLGINDKVYYCKQNDIDYRVGGISEITRSYITCDFSDAQGRSRLKITDEFLDSSRLRDTYSTPQYSQFDLIIFTLESDAIRYCKTNLLKELRKKIQIAKAKIQEVVNFRLENIDHLNKDWIEWEVLKLERLEREKL